VNLPRKPLQRLLHGLGAAGPAYPQSTRVSSVRSGLKACLAVSATLIALLSGLTAGATQALAAGSPWYRVTSRQTPTNLPPGGEGTIVVQAINLGNGPTSGSYDFSDTLPAGVTLQEVEYLAPHPPGIELEDFNFAPLEYCKSDSHSVSCSSESPIFEGNPEFMLNPVLPYAALEMHLRVKAETGAVSGGLNTIEVSGGAARSVTIKRAVPISSQPVPFGVEDFSLVPEDEGGEVDTHAGSHPYQLTNVLTFNSSDDSTTFDPPALPRDLNFKLPPGQIGNATALPQCNDEDFSHVTLGGEANLCKGNTVIGVAVVTASTSPGLEKPFVVPVFNLTPATGEPARFGFEVLRNPVILDTAVRSGPGEDYGVTVAINNITELVNFMSATVTFWGTPGDPSHNSARDWGCLLGGRYTSGSGLVCEPSVEEHAAALLTLPTNCTSPFEPSVEGVAWPTKAAPAGFTFPAVPYDLQDGSGDPLGLTGCNQLAFSPTITAEATTESASSPSGLDFNLNFDDEGLTNGKGVAQSQLQDTVVTLPEGFTINPSAGVGLGGCTEADYARETIESPPGAGCPNNSKLGTVEIETPLLSQKVKGSIFIAQPYENPSNSLVALYVVAKSPETGVLIKLAGKVTPDPVTGQLVTSFEGNPQLPFSHFNFHFREGQQAPLISPPTCGSYALQATLTPWSDPTSTLTDTSSFTITKGAEGGECPTGGAPPFHPQLQAGTLNNNAGTFSPLDVRLTRTDAEQEISSFSTDLPRGLTGDLSGIPFCSEAAIALARTKSGAQEESAPSCPAASQVGRTLVGTGVGAVLAYVPGKIYLGGPYHGDPFSIVSVTSAIVGPFDLGTIVLRFALRIDPNTAQVSVDPSASEPIPHIIDGIVTHVRDIRVYIDRQNFTLNPTNCTPTSISSTLGSSLGQSVAITSPYQAASCANLKFAPKFSASTSGKTSKARGASLSVKLTYPPAPTGTYANITRVKVDLPRQLPSQLKTLQKACTAAQFEANPAGCPAASMVGHAKAVTPLIPVPLEGPAIFVSHGNEAFPSLIMVLQGYGVTIDLVGTTFISQAGITSSTFKTVPDQPISSFELTLPQGKYSALAASGDLCTSKLAMPTEFLAQNGAKINQSTKVSVTGCAKSKPLTRPQRLTKALKACKQRTKAKRAVCQRQARRRYGPVKRTKQRDSSQATNNRRTR
jgi:hypothetical protein